MRRYRHPLFSARAPFGALVEAAGALKRGREVRYHVVHRLLLTTALAASAALTYAATAAAITVIGTFDATDPLYTAVAATFSSCVSPPTVIGPFAIKSRYDTYSFTNTSASAQCVTVTVVAANGTGILFSAYADSANYVLAPGTALIGAGDCLSAGQSGQFSVAAGQKFLLVVSPCGGAITYSIDVTGTGITGGAAVAAVLRGAPTATAGAKGATVRWRTASEVDALGFNVYRAVQGKRVRANARLIPARGAGAYSFLDRKAPQGKALRYWVQLVNRDGSRSWYGPARLARP